MLMIFSDKVSIQRRVIAEFLIVALDAHRMLQHHVSQIELKPVVDSINRMRRRYDKLTRIQRRLRDE